MHAESSRTYVRYSCPHTYPTAVASCTHVYLVLPVESACVMEEDAPPHSGQVLSHARAQQADLGGAVGGVD